MKSFEFIEMFKQKNHLGSDYMAAKALGVTRQSISHYKNGRPLDDDLALPLAESLGIEPSEILYVIRAEKARDSNAKNKWLELAKSTSIAGAIALSLNVVPMLVNPSVSTVSAATLNNNNIHYTNIWTGKNLSRTRPENQFSNMYTL